MTAVEASFEDRLFGGLVPGRDCGACTACCFELTIDDAALSKPPRQTCVHCVAEGCAIYAKRPQDCRSWFCLWRRIADLSDALRPERSGLMACLMADPAAANPFQRIYIVVQWLDGRPIARSDTADALLAVLCRYDLPVWVGSGDRMALHFPGEEIALQIMGAAAPTPDLAPQVDAWRRRLPGRPPFEKTAP